MSGEIGAMSTREKIEGRGFETVEEAAVIRKLPSGAGVYEARFRAIGYGQTIETLLTVDAHLSERLILVDMWKGILDEIERRSPPDSTPPTSKP